MNYYDDPEAYKAKGIDYDFFAMLEYNPQDYALIQVNKILAVVEGENDGPDWHWVIDTTQGIFYTRGGCDYTGWDCQSSAGSTLLGPAFDKRKLAIAMEKQRNHYDEDSSLRDWYFSLVTQMEGGKILTWREIMDDELGLTGQEDNDG